MISVFCILFLLPNIFALQAFNPYTDYSQLNLPPGPFGPDSVALDRFSQGPYVGVSDGRILKYNGSQFVDFAYTSPSRTKELCDGVRDINLGPTCGRPLGFSFDPLTGFLYIVDAYGGLYRVGPEGGRATFLANSANGTRFNYLDGIDFDRKRRVVYFTDLSLAYTFRDALLGNATSPSDSTGRLLEYNTKTGQVRVLAQSLPRPAGPAVNVFSTYVLYSSLTKYKIFKYWLVGPEANTIEALPLNLPGYPVKVKRAPMLETFWVAVNVIVVQQQQWVIYPYGYKFNSNGEVLLIKNLTDQYPNAQVNVVQEYGVNILKPQIFIGSRVVPYVGIYDSKWW